MAAADERDVDDAVDANADVDADADADADPDAQKSTAAFATATIATATTAITIASHHRRRRRCPQGVRAVMLLVVSGDGLEPAADTLFFCACISHSSEGV